MARRGISRSPGYKPGSHWAICDTCGFQFRAEDLLETWDKRWVCDDDFEHRHEQDFLRVKEERIHVDQPIRLDSTSNISPDTTLGNVTTLKFIVGTTTSVCNRAEADRAVCNDREIPLSTFGMINALTDPST